MDRRRARWTLLAVVGLLLAAAAVAVFVTRPAEEEEAAVPPAEQGLLPWAPRGAFSSDQALLAEAVAAWQTGVLVDGARAPAPVGETYVLWAGKIGAGRLFVLEGVSPDGTPLVAQVAEHGDPATFGLDAVEELPAEPPPALAVTYDGNLDLPGLGVGEGAGLVQLLQAPTSETDQRALWRQLGRVEGNELELLEMRDASMSQTFLHLGGPEDPPARVVVGSVGVRAGILTTLDVRPDELIPTPSAVALADGQLWGASGRIDGGEDVDARLAASETSADAAQVREVVAGTGEIDGAPIAARLLEVDTDAGSAHLVLIARGDDGEVVCISSRGPFATDPSGTAPPGGSPIVLLGCASREGNVRVTAAAAPEAAGAVRLSGVPVPPEGESGRVVVIEPYVGGARQAVVAALADDPSIAVTLPPLT